MYACIYVRAASIICIYIYISYILIYFCLHKGVITLLLTLDPKFLGHLGSCETRHPLQIGKGEK